MRGMGILYIVGLGLSSQHLTLEALSALSKADVVFVEAYTSIPEQELPVFLSKIAPLTVFQAVSRRELEDECASVILEELGKNKSVALAVVGDPFIATTHTALRLEALRRGHKVFYVPGINVVSYAISVTGLFNYKFGGSATIVYPRWNIASETPYRVLEANKKLGYHTFFFLDISEEEGPMRPNVALELLLDMEERVGGSLLSTGDYIVVLQRLGMQRERVYYLSIGETLERVWGDPPYSIIVPGSLHPIEREALEVFKR